jgi:hypothetical protein
MIIALPRSSIEISSRRLRISFMVPFAKEEVLLAHRSSMATYKNM